MEELSEIVGLEELIRGTDVRADEPFEATYSRLVEQGHYKEVTDEIESRVEEYFTGLELPPEPTLYDRLILSLRTKDLIATFNWDPLLLQAYFRVRRGTKAPLPRVVFLHGCVAVGYCAVCPPTRYGMRGTRCSQCGERFQKVPLLFPVREKDYEGHPAIRTGWNLLREELRECWLFTIFGYGAPVSDASAMSLLKEAWGGPNLRSMEQIELINTLPEDKALQSWRRFTNSHHYEHHTRFDDSILGRFPRRSVESMQAQIIDMCEDFDAVTLPASGSWDELLEPVAELVRVESQRPKAPPA